MSLVLHHSWYGSTRDYAAEFARRIDAEVLPLSHLHPQQLTQRSDGSPIVIFSAIHGPTMPAIDFVRRHPELVTLRPVAIACVGMTLLTEARQKDKMARSLGELAQNVARFYLPGRLLYSELSAKHRIMMTGIISALKAKPYRTDNEKAMIAGFGKDVDHTDYAELAPIVEWYDSNFG
ncbi:hypothetical protein GP475_04260 [Corynebacterium poyangense]|uniref:Flavodoxin domain-containing protein n=1 Tax=Corynebacterium poyangense TaxID=2684405 RepID=A0A7H0SN18_9CORY|nr:flavodoxin domain-containing protein [Corynebacterium poyangense]MBZ8176957.1 hypothetical protein [Corynebacterium poyangense]QNQ89943.1 hypothetical protein GP475_04260 [Corynebacterium poyangense]